jgi:hypothetical protein
MATAAIPTSTKATSRIPSAQPGAMPTASSRDAVKGDVARMLFFMDVRDAGADGVPDLTLIDEDSNRPGRRIGAPAAPADHRDAGQPQLGHGVFRELS